MDLSTYVLHIAENRNLTPLQQRRVRGVLSALENLLGQVELPDEGSLVKVPGSDDDWVILYAYADGQGFDIIPVGAMDTRSILTGWVPGQSMASYQKELRSLPDDDPTPENGGRAHLTCVSR
jgi:hypothetical protein